MFQYWDTRRRDDWDLICECETDEKQAADAYFILTLCYDPNRDPYIVVTEETPYGRRIVPNIPPAP
jgi:hypothetical protein